jgi:hypothetical protein
MITTMCGRVSVAASPAPVIPRAGVTGSGTAATPLVVVGIDSIQTAAAFVRASCFYGFDTDGTSIVKNHVEPSSPRDPRCNEFM